MRITRLLLGRYGHVSDVELVFDPGVNLHIVLGANEAGKSTALSAIGDALFGFGHKTPFAFLHRSQDLRLGIGVRAQDGQEGFFLRRKGRQDTLRDAEDAVVPEAALSRFLAGASREKFADLFGMDGAELRRGGAAILEGKGEIGQSIVQAHTGLHNVRAALGRLNEAALELYGDKRGGRAFHVAAEAFHAARRDVEARSIRPLDYGQAAAERDEIRDHRARNRLESENLQGERARLDRIRRTTPARLALLRDRDMRTALGEIPSLPENAEALRSRSVQAQTILGLEFSRAQQKQSEDEAARDALRVDETLLASGDAIDALAADVNRIEQAARDRQTRRLEADQARSRVEEAGRRLGVALHADGLVERLPGAFLRAEAARAIQDFAALTARRQDVAAASAQAETQADSARRYLASLAVPQPVEALAACVDSAAGEGRLDAECASAEEACSAAQAALLRSLAALPLWRGDAEALARAPVPLATALAQGEAALTAAQAAYDERQRDVARSARADAELEADLAGVLAAGVPPTAEAIAAARAGRDAAWQAIHLHLDGKAMLPAPALAELAGGLAGAIAAADQLADRRTAEAERVALYEQLRAQKARLSLVRHAEETARMDAEAALAASQADWERLWQPAGVVPGDPARMREWLARRQAILGLLEDAQAKARLVARLQARRDAVCKSLLSVLPAGRGYAADRVAPLLQAATLQRREREQALSLHAEGTRSLAETERGVAEQDRKRQALEQDMSAWLAAWGPIAQALGLPPGAGAEAGAEALSVWAEIETHARDMRAAQQRIGEMTADIEVFANGVAALCAACAQDLAGETPIAAMRGLAARLAQHRAAAADRARLAADIAAREAALAALAQDIAKAQDDLAALRALAKADDDAALQAAIARATAAAALDRAMAERARELGRLDDGHTLAELAAEAEGEEADLLPGRIAAIDERMRDIAAENEAFASRLRDLDTRIAAMERGHDAAEAAQRLRDSAAEAEDIAARYVRLRLSHTLLRAGVERFRREQQAPLLDAAGQCFAALTEGRYTKLAVEDEDDTKVVVALRPDGTHCPADRLSEGTRDQLFLALRLAAIRSHATQAEPLPFIADDLLASFDDRRARATLKMLADFGAVTQTILFTHHDHIAAMADTANSRVHVLPLG